MDDWPVNDVLSDTVMGLAETLHFYREDGAWRIAFVLNEKGGARLMSIPREGGTRRSKPRLELGGDVSVYETCVNTEGRAAVAVATMMDAGDLFSLRLDGSGHSRRLTRGNAAFFKRLQLSEPEEHWFGSGSQRIQGWILKPPGMRKGRRYPMLLQIHGGPMAQYGYTFFHEMHLLAARGYVVVFSNPRGSTGYGTNWVKAITGRWGSVDYDDLMTVTNAVARKPYVDSRRMGVLGGSYGGFMSTWILGHSKRFKAGVTMRQAGNRLIQFGASDFGWYEYYQFGGFPWEKPMQYLKRSPNFYAENITAPLLIIHSENDLRCPVAQADELFTMLKFQGRTVEYIRFEGESHGLSRGGKPLNRLERLRRIVDWFDRYL
jgi:dipeptidyl aminopeptidase/acylaminoacyl peptidase